MSEVNKEVRASKYGLEQVNQKFCSDLDYIHMPKTVPLYFYSRVMREKSV